VAGRDAGDDVCSRTARSDVEGFPESVGDSLGVLSALGFCYLVLGAGGFDVEDGLVGSQADFGVYSRSVGMGVSVGQRTGIYTEDECRDVNILQGIVLRGPVDAGCRHCLVGSNKVLSVLVN
jgi:hypothetical protein